MDSFQTEDEQLERLKAWWGQYGTYVIYGIVLGILVIVGTNYWRHYRHAQADTASSLYQAMTQDYQTGKRDAAQAAGAKLMSDLSGTPYAGKAALLLAKMSVERKDPASAKAQLTWAMDNAKETPVRQVARLRLGRLLLDEGQTDPALALIDAGDAGGFTGQYDELRGDILVKKGRAAQAREAYQRALAALSPNSAYARVLSMKLDDLGRAQNGQGQ